MNKPMLPYDSYKQEHLVVLLFVVSDYLMFLCFAMLYKKFTQFSKLFKHWNKQIVYHFSCGKVSFNQIKVAIIGSGPAGFYTSQALLKDPRTVIDIYEKFPVPFGLVRFGVAPDHPEVKNVINSFTNTAKNNRVSFIGNVNIGHDITLGDLRQAYNVIVLCYGAAQDKFLNVPGENLPNVISARRFVGWYNGVPQDKNIAINFDCETAVIIGQGNVALDCARILLTPIEDVKTTDITSYSIDKLSKSKIKTVYIIGRRGPLQVSFTIKEFREMTKIKNCHVSLLDEDLSFIDSNILNSLTRPRKRLTELLIKISKENPENENSKNCCFVRFYRSSIEIKGDMNNGVTSIILGINKKNNNLNQENEEVSLTDKREELKCGLVLRSIGYKTISIDPSLPFDERKGTIKNENGRVIGCGPGLYCSGWVGSGPSGVIVNTMNFSFEVGKNILQDISDGKLNIENKEGISIILEKLKSKNVDVIHFDEWEKIDQFEKELGAMQGKTREKVVDINLMIKTAKKVLNDK